MATEEHKANFRIPSDVWKRFVVACEEQSTFPSTVLRDFCEEFTANQAACLRAQRVSNQKKQLGFGIPERDPVPYTSEKILGSVSYIVGWRCGCRSRLAEVVVDGVRYRTEPAWVNDYDQDSCDTWEKTYFSTTKTTKALILVTDVLFGLVMFAS